MKPCFCNEGKTGTCVYFVVSLQMNSLCTYYYVCMSVFVSNPGSYCFSLETSSYIFSVTAQANNGVPQKENHSPPHIPSSSLLPSQSLPQKHPKQATQEEKKEY